jgi:hypothetical protein
MVSPALARLLIVVFAAATSSYCADDVLWGPVESGLQLGIGIKSTPEPTLRVSLRNIGTKPRDLLIGYEGSIDLYNVGLTTQSPEQQELAVLELNAIKAYPSSLILPISAHLKPGEEHEFIYPLSQLSCVVNRRDVPFRVLLAQGYTVWASFEFPGTKLTSPELLLRQ